MALGAFEWWQLEKCQNLAFSTKLPLFLRSYHKLLCMYHVFKLIVCLSSTGLECGCGKRDVIACFESEGIATLLNKSASCWWWDWIDLEKVQLLALIVMTTLSNTCVGYQTLCRYMYMCIHCHCTCVSGQKLTSLFWLLVWGEMLFCVYKPQCSRFTLVRLFS